MDYKVTITETSKMEVSVEADNQFEAERIVSDRWRNCEYILDADNFVGVKFSTARKRGEILEPRKNNQ